MQQLTAFLDANVLYTAGLRDLFMRLALNGLFEIKWSDQVHEEWIRNLLLNRPDLTPEKLERTRHLMDAASPGSRVVDYEDSISALQLPDQDDRHILAAAIVGKADVIVTFNLADFPAEALDPYGIEAWHPDRFIQHLLNRNPERVCAAMRQHRLALKAPPKTVADYLLDRQQDGLRMTVDQLDQYKSQL